MPVETAEAGSDIITTNRGTQVDHRSDRNSSVALRALIQLC
jgi:hypothetical protein